jgi:hypothetical protein
VAAEIPDALVLKRHRDLVGRRHDIWVRRGLLVLLGLVPALALGNLFGQRPSVTTIHATPATLQLYAPSRVRGGLLWEARFRVTANQELKDAILELDGGWLEGMSVNTIEPSPVGEGSHDGNLVLDLGHIPKGETYALFMQFQVNPTNIGHRSAGVRLYDDKQLLVTVRRKVTVFP